MRKYIQFYKYDLDNNVSRLLASDGVCDVDGRLNGTSIHLFAIKRKEFLKNVQKGIIGYSVHYGNYSDNQDNFTNITKI